MTAGPQHESAVTHNDTWPWSPDERPHVTVHDTRAPASDPSGPSIPPAVWFFLLTAFGISWGAIFLRRAADEGLRLTTKFGPSIAGLIAAFRVGRMVGVRDITRRLLTVRVRIAWFALCLFLPVIISMGSLAIRSIFGSDVWRIVPLAPGHTALCRRWLGRGVGLAGIHVTAPSGSNWRPPRQHRDWPVPRSLASPRVRDCHPLSHGVHRFRCHRLPVNVQSDRRESAVASADARLCQR